MPPSNKPSPSLIINTQNGPISGVEKNGIYSFKGIPYAAPPLGERRWLPPQPALPWTEVMDGSQYQTIAPQPLYPKGSFFKQPNYPQSEDCLHLNIWTSSPQPREKKAVMVWIHGGYFNYGGGALPHYEGTRLAEENVVLVTINYRLGVLGFLGHPALSEASPAGVSGNYGLLDQIAALQWIKANIESFGGDPNNITLFGESAGAWSISLLVVSPLAKGLFHRAIAQSGGATGPTPYLKEEKYGKLSGEKAGLRFAKAAGASSLSALRDLSVADILKASQGAGFYTEPYVDGWFLPDEPRFLMEQGTMHQIPILLGSNQDEATAFADPQTLPTTAEEFIKSLHKKYGDLAPKILEGYPVEKDSDVLKAHLNRLGDQLFTLSMRHWARRSAQQQIPTYLYYFTRIPNIPQKDYYGSYHGAEIPYAFGNLHKIPVEGIFDSYDYDLSRHIMTYWTEFAKTGTPNTPASPAWEAYQKETAYYLELGDEVALKQHLLAHRLDILEEVTKRRQASVVSHIR